MRPLRRSRTSASTPREHVDAMTDLEDKDREIDSLLSRADDLVGELRKSLAQVSAALQGPATGEEGDDDGG